MKKVCVLLMFGALALPASSVHAQTRLTTDQAYKKARKCLLASGKVRLVGRSDDGGGYAFFRGYAAVSRSLTV